ncbi:rhodanese-related sulfurtransferase [Allopusillimonas soli]|uniref:tRNA uridine(34) hydroxylase n=1 Tax=Allopusillimonas soli TaxID=659016 RepID=A0A853FDH0_9BURK|nr:rhodanese-related sulfurtransferase [Allopusillimonas soli]NYT36116.1 rhodanese-related sulfurtransferase [Allopusillimonas soli]TEA76452.1 rhodanese-related sulfurtransferase [Allopusillimonas soli]
MPESSSSSILVAALYKFVELADFRDMRQPLLDLCEARGITGTLLLAREGINGTIAGEPDALRAVLTHLRTDPRLADLEHKESQAPAMPFYRMKVKLKREIVTMGVPDIDPENMAGTYVEPDEWNRLVDDPDTVVVDVRNDYEVGIGSFRGAVNPHTTSFSAFPQWVREQSGEGGVLARGAKVAMFCTGGIRCEKSTAYLRSQGFDQVFHLRGGILKYLETVPEADSRWDGQCFVFDERVSVGHGLAPGEYALCRACRMPLSAEDKLSEHFQEGISCPHCHDRHTPEQKRRFAERQRQVELARERHARHIGARMPSPHHTRDQASPESKSLPTGSEGESMTSAH